jgi:hypothetical protein
VAAIFPDAGALTEEEVGLYMLGTKTMTQAELAANW